MPGGECTDYLNIFRIICCIGKNIKIYVRKVCFLVVLYLAVTAVVVFKGNWFEKPNRLSVHIKRTTNLSNISQPALRGVYKAFSESVGLTTSPYKDLETDTITSKQIIGSTENVPNRSTLNDLELSRIEAQETLPMTKINAALNSQTDVNLSRPVESWDENLDLMKMTPFKFLPNYKNPCWHNPISDPPISCLPYFYLIGAPKSGTTDVFYRLQAHPDFAPPLAKEPHWITRVRFASIRHSSLQFYTKKFFSKPASEIYKNTDKSGFHWKITGDCSASTLFDNFNWRSLPHDHNSEEPQLTNADYIHHLNPDVRILVILREPVDRLYSDFLCFNNNYSQTDFHNAVVQQLGQFDQCRQKHSLRACLYNTSIFKGQKPRVRLHIGIYHVHLKEFFRVFRKDHILVIKLEEYSKNQDSAVRQIFRFLGLNETTELRRELNTTGHRNSRRKKDVEKGPMWNVTKHLLQTFYRPHNDELVKLLKDERFNYKAMYS